MQNLINVVNSEVRTDGREGFVVAAYALYNAVINFLNEHDDALKAFAAMSDGQLVDKALAGDALAAFVLRNRTVTDELLAVNDGGWQLAFVPRNMVIAAEGEDAGTERDPVVIRAKALEAARRFFTAALRDYAAQPIGLHILKDEAFRL